MSLRNNILLKSIAVVLTTGMLFSCTNDSKKVRDFLADKNLPIGIAKDAYHEYKDSGRVTSKLITPYYTILAIEKDILIMNSQKE